MKRPLEDAARKQPHASQEECSHQNPTILAPDLRLPSSRNVRNKFCCLSCPVFCVCYSIPSWRMQCVATTWWMTEQHPLDKFPKRSSIPEQGIFPYSALRWGDHIQYKAIISCVPWFWFWPLGEVSLFSQSYTSGRIVSYSRMSSM